MSATNRGGERTPLDAYYTPDAVARACVATIADDVRGVTAWEPHAGGGAFVRALMAARCWVAFSDIDGHAPVYWKHDAVPQVPGRFVTSLPAQDALGEWFRPDDGRNLAPAWIVGNPPYDRAQEHVERALSLATDGVAFLLRLAFLESTKRLPFWRANPPAEVHVLSRRPSFTGGGTDSAAYGWFVWRKRNTASPRLGWIDWSAS